MQPSNFPYFTRRQALQGVACGFGYLALAGMTQNSRAAVPSSTNPLAPKTPHHTPRAKRVIFIFQQGGPSQVDTFDYKPRLERDNGQQLRFDDARVLANTMTVRNHKVMKSPWNFRRYGQSDRWVSDLFPEMARHVDDMCFLYGMHTNGVAHGPSTLFLHTGSINLVRPSVGAWVTYGLGTENQNLPGFVTICPPMNNGGPRNFGNAFLPASFQGTQVGRTGMRVADARIRNLTNSRRSRTEQRQQFDLLQSMNQEQMRRSTGSLSGDTELEAVINSYELAFRMQTHAPNTLDLSRETPATLQMYGIDQRPTENFGRQCLMARRLAEAGVRYIQVTYGDNSNNPAWDQHSNLPKHAYHARAVDKPVAGLIQDLKQRGLLEDTLIWWGGEFGRTPYAQNNGTGRDHNPYGFTQILLGGGVKPGFGYGETDEFGHHAIQGKVHMHDMHATILHLLGLNHEELTFRFDGRDFRLTDVHGRVVHDIIA